MHFLAGSYQGIGYHPLTVGKYSSVISDLKARSTCSF